MKIFLPLILIGSLIFIAYILFIILNPSKPKLEITEENILAECSNEDIIESCKCLNKFVNQMYFYNESKKKKVGIIIEKNDFGDEYIIFEPEEELFLNDLSENGGVFWNYANFYYYFSKKLGFNSRIDGLDKDEEGGHVYTMVSNEEGYCKLDQKNIDCFRYNLN